MDTRTLKKDHKPIELSAKEYALLAFLVENDGKPISPETKYEKV
jgi:DNA-binding response OmpR family regulator